NGGGFRTVGVQLDRVRLGGGFTVSGFDNEDPGTSSLAASLATGRHTSEVVGTLPPLINRNLISKSQFKDRGFGVLDRNPDGTILAREGRVGLQWRHTRVRGPVDIRLANLVLQPGAGGAASTASSVAAAESTPGKTVIDFTTNTGKIRKSQFNDGGFGDI